jgi:hypothetical protein
LVNLEANEFMNLQSATVDQGLKVKLVLHFLSTSVVFSSHVAIIGVVDSRGTEGTHGRRGSPSRFTAPLGVAKLFRTGLMRRRLLGSSEATRMPRPVDPRPVLQDNPGHGEDCPNCGKPTRLWFYDATKAQLKCKHCGFKGQVSNTPIPGLHVDSTSRRVWPMRA